jgi:hypothetical protein
MLGRQDGLNGAAGASDHAYGNSQFEFIAGGNICGNIE